MCLKGALNARTIKTSPLVTRADNVSQATNGGSDELLQKFASRIPTSVADATTCAHVAAVLAAASGLRGRRRCQ